MKRNQKDTIIISAIVNVGIIAALLMVALIDEDSENSIEPKEEYILQRPESRLSSLPQVEIPQEKQLSIEPPRSLPEVAVNQGPQDSSEEDSFVEVTVKRGDALDKIARANGSTIAEIKKINGLESDRLQIGQQLKVPLHTKESEAPSSSLKESSNSFFYTIQSGDNPWTVAKKFQANYEDILKLNHLDEERAKNLKIGDKIRIK